MEAYAASTSRTRSPGLPAQRLTVRLGLGQNEQANANLTKYEGLYKKDNPELAAKIFWSKHDILKTDEEVKHAEDYLKTTARPAASTVASSPRPPSARYLWRQSCDKGLLHDSCMTVERKVGAGR